MLTERALRVLEAHVFLADPVADARAFLFEMLDPTPDRGDMLYRYEHSLRVAAIGRAIARAEGLPEEPLVLACLLHDIGYRDSLALDEYSRHHLIGAEIAREYLAKAGYDAALSREIVLGVERHCLTDSLPADMTVFLTTVRDSDDIDRCGPIRTAMLLGRCVDEKTDAQILAACEEAVARTKRFAALPRGTATARRLIDERCEKRVSLLEELAAQARMA